MFSIHHHYRLISNWRLEQRKFDKTTTSIDLVLLLDAALLPPRAE